MLTVVTIGYSQRESCDRTPAALRDAAHEHDRKLREAGALIGIAGLPVQVRNPGDAGAVTTDGPFMTSAMPIAGPTIIEAADPDEAIGMVSPMPCAIARGVVEVWPLGRPG